MLSQQRFLLTLDLSNSKCRILINEDHLVRKAKVMGMANQLTRIFRCKEQESVKPTEDNSNANLFAMF